MALLGMFTTFTASAQNNVGIGTASPDASAALEIESTTQGFLPPRLSSTQRDAIAAPVAVGLIVWCTNCGTNGEVQVYNGSAWTNMVGAAAALSLQERLDGGETPFSIYNTLVTGGSTSSSAALDSLYGKTYQGGLIAYLDTNTGTGLIARPTDFNASWGCSASPITGADGIAIGTGAQNTIDIEAGCVASGTAADICANLVLSGYTDWFLPSKDELNAMYQNIGPGNALGLGNVGVFASVAYWSSTEASGGGAFRQNFVNGNQATNFGKGTVLYVRAARAF